MMGAGETRMKSENTEVFILLKEEREIALHEIVIRKTTTLYSWEFSVCPPAEVKKGSSPSNHNYILCTNEMITGNSTQYLNR